MDNVKNLNNVNNLNKKIQLLNQVMMSNHKDITILDQTGEDYRLEDKRIYNGLALVKYYKNKFCQKCKDYTWKVSYFGNEPGNKEIIYVENNRFNVVANFLLAFVANDDKDYYEMMREYTDGIMVDVIESSSTIDTAVVEVYKVAENTKYVISDASGIIVDK